MPLKPIYIANTVPELVERVQEIISLLNDGVSSSNADFANTANNALHAFFKDEDELNVNSALFAETADVAAFAEDANTANTANNATFAYGKAESDLNVNSAAQVLFANNAGHLQGKLEADLNVNSSLTANNATFAYGKTEGNLNVNSALHANNSLFLGGVAAANTLAPTQFAGLVNAQGILYSAANGTWYNADLASFPAGGNTGDSLNKTISSYAWGERLVRHTTRKSAWVNYWGSNLTPTSVGLPVVTTAGTMSDGSNNALSATKFTTSTINNLIGARGSGTIFQFQTMTNPIMIVDFTTGPSISSVRFMFGWWLAQTPGGDAATNFDVAIFRYSTSNTEIGWVALTNDGSSNNGVVSDKILDIGTSQRYRLQIEATGNGTSLTFTISNSTVTNSATMATRIPVANSAMNWICHANNLASETKTLSLTKTYFEWD